MKIAFIDGSPREKSHSRKLLYLADKKLRQRGINTFVFDQTKSKLPQFDDDSNTVKDPNIQELFSIVKNSDCIILSSPEYHNGMSGAIKNALDWLSMIPKDERPKQMLCGLMGGGGSFGNSGAMLQLMMVARSMHWWLMPDVLMNIPAIWDSMNNGKLVDSELEIRLNEFLENLVSYSFMFKKLRNEISNNLSLPAIVAAC